MSYNAGPIERRAGQVRFYSGGTRAGVVFFDGAAMSMPAEPFMKVGLAPGDAFVMVVTRIDGKGRILRCDGKEHSEKSADY
jgi:hypothetical protein